MLFCLFKSGLFLLPYLPWVQNFCINGFSWKIEVHFCFVLFCFWLAFLFLCLKHLPPPPAPPTSMLYVSVAGAFLHWKGGVLPSVLTYLIPTSLYVCWSKNLVNSHCPHQINSLFFTFFFSASWAVGRHSGWVLEPVFAMPGPSACPRWTHFSGSFVKPSPGL